MKNYRWFYAWPPSLALTHIKSVQRSGNLPSRQCCDGFRRRYSPCKRYGRMAAAVLLTKIKAVR
ncbi:hypothetical protein GGE67_004364 [Rhizobium leucaenae]|nr:hypothetical protein [Rhizobium leucaenae]